MNGAKEHPYSDLIDRPLPEDIIGLQMTINRLIKALSSGRALDVPKTVRKLAEAWEAFERITELPVVED